MTPEQILAIPPRVLTQSQRESYFSEGYILLEAIIGSEWINKLRDATDEMIERSRKVTKSDTIFDLEPDHRPDSPRLRRVSNPTEHHPVFWDYVNKSVMPDAVADLVGPDVKFHHSKLNFKWKQGGEEVKWHYDISFWPHTNYSPVTIGTYLYDCGMGQGPLGVIPQSHLLDDPMLSQYDEQGRWVGCLSERDVARLNPQRAVYLTGPAGSLTLHNCRTVHGSPRNDSDLGRCVSVYGQSDQTKARPSHHSRQARCVRAPRSAPVPDSAGLVGRLYVHLFVAAGRGCQGGERRNDVM